MQRGYLIAGLMVILIIIGLAVYVLTSNLTRADGTAQFSPGENGLNTLEITAPAGWLCMEFTKVPELSTAPTTRLTVMGKGYSDCPMFGALTLLSNTYPDSGITEHIPLDEPTMIYQSGDKAFEIYVWITKDKNNFDNLESIIDGQ